MKDVTIRQLLELAKTEDSTLVIELKSDQRIRISGLGGRDLGMTGAGPFAKAVDDFHLDKAKNAVVKAAEDWAGNGYGVVVRLQGAVEKLKRLQTQQEKGTE